MMHNDDNMFVFKNTRTVSGNTLDAFPALMTGCLPYNDTGQNLLKELGNSVGYSFYNAGYSTASFSSSIIDNGIASGKYKYMYDELVGGMDYVIDPLRKGWHLDNGEGSDDRKMLPEFEAWLHEEVNVKEANGTERGVKAPFYAQFYAFNQVRFYSLFLQDQSSTSHIWHLKPPTSTIHT